MPKLNTRYFGELEYEAEAIVEFPAGLPGFESERQFILVDRADLKPLVFVQSLATPELCFPALPVLSVLPDYKLAMTEADREALGLPQEPRIGQDVACLAVLNVRENSTVANLLAPLVIGLKHRRAVQAIQAESDYSHQYELEVPEAEAKCS
ncbi:MAG TPA: flagellar assembly protein FliW [Bryobacteraceae bacterium]